MGPALAFERLVVRSPRSRLAGTVRLPSWILTDGTATVRRAVGAAIYRGYDVVHRLDMRLPPAPYPEILTIHDVVSWRFPDEGVPPAPAIAEARRAAVVICPSQFSADEIHYVLGVSNAVAIPNGVAEQFFAARPLGEADLAQLGVRGRYVLHAGGCSLRKNLSGLASSWALVSQARPDVSLVLAGPPDSRRDELFRPLPRTVLTGRVPPRA